MLQLREFSAAAGLFQEVVDTSDPEDSGTPKLVATALRRNSLIHRLWLRPAAGERIWSKSRVLSVGGSILKKPQGVAAADEQLIVADPGLREIILLDATGRAQSKSSEQSPRRPSWSLLGVPIGVAEERVVILSSRSHHTFTDPTSKRAEALDKIKAAEQGRFGAWTVLTSRPSQMQRLRPHPAARRDARVEAQR